MICRKSDINSIEITCRALLNGQVVIIPTDTVYGFSAVVGGDVDTKSKIMRIKGRDENKPFIQLISKPQDISKYTDDIIPDELLKYWPGPLTIIVNDLRLKNQNISTTAFRCPGDEWLRNLIEKCGYPLYSTSVNRSGSPVLQTEDEIIKEFENDASVIVLNGDTGNALPSTIVKMENGKVVVIRKGAVDL